MPPTTRFEQGRLPTSVRKGNMSGITMPELDYSVAGERTTRSSGGTVESDRPWESCTDPAVSRAPSMRPTPGPSFSRAHSPCASDWWVPARWTRSSPHSWNTHCQRRTTSAARPTPRLGHELPETRVRRPSIPPTITEARAVLRQPIGVDAFRIDLITEVIGDHEAPWRAQWLSLYASMMDCVILPRELGLNPFS